MMNNTKKPLNLKRVTILTSIIILLPIFYGLAVYHELPAQIAIHWGVNNQPNGWASRPMAVFGIPVLMMLIQWFMLGTYAINARTKGRTYRMEVVTFSIMPILTIVLYVTTLAIAMGMRLNVGKIATLVIGVMFVAMGNYLPTVTYEQQVGSRHYPKPSSAQNWAVASRSIGYTMFFGGLLMLISLLFPMLVSAIVVAVIIILIVLFSIRGAMRHDN